MFSEIFFPTSAIFFRKIRSCLTIFWQHSDTFEPTPAVFWQHSDTFEPTPAVFVGQFSTTITTTPRHPQPRRNSLPNEVIAMWLAPCFRMEQLQSLMRMETGQVFFCLHSRFTLPETNSSHLKVDGWNTGSFWYGLFSGVMLVSGSVLM